MYNPIMKEEASMKNRILALTLLIVMLFTLSACSKKPEPAPAETPAPTAEPTPEPTPEPTAEPTPEPTPAGIEPDSGVHTIVSKTKNFSVDFDSKYVANELPSGSIIINAGTEEGIPYCTVGLMEKEIMGIENVTDAVGYLSSLGASAVEELGDSLITAPGEPATFIEGRDLYVIYYTYNNEEAGGTIVCAYYAEDLDGEVVVFNSTALEKDNAAVSAIVQLCVDSFKLLGQPEAPASDAA